MIKLSKEDHIEIEVKWVKGAILTCADKKVHLPKGVWVIHHLHYTCPNEKPAITVVEAQ